MKKIICLVVSVLVCSFASFAQDNAIPQRLELAEVEVNDGAARLEIFDMPVAGRSHYYLSVGHLGVGDEIVQINFDPLFELFIPLGDTLTEAEAMLEQFRDLYKADPDTSIEVTGCLAFGFPSDQLEPVKVTFRRFLFRRLLAFSVERDGLLRVTHVAKSDFGSLMSSLKFYRMLHQDEE